MALDLRAGFLDPTLGWGAAVISLQASFVWQSLAGSRLLGEKHCSLVFLQESFGLLGNLQTLVLLLDVDLGQELQVHVMLRNSMDMSAVQKVKQSIIPCLLDNQGERISSSSEMNCSLEASDNGLAIEVLRTQIFNQASNFIVQNHHHLPLVDNVPKGYP